MDFVKAGLIGRRLCSSNHRHRVKLKSSIRESASSDLFPIYRFMTWLIQGPRTFIGTIIVCRPATDMKPAVHRSNMTVIA
ncbi:hypothetical protein GBA52_025600 [Prunus armeniaca]|nr:hypothetical protein GBA52_025600 [Prunus armeniaca]